jgi:hypothetical protein
MAMVLLPCEALYIKPGLEAFRLLLANIIFVQVFLEEDICIHQNIVASFAIRDEMKSGGLPSHIRSL